MSRLGHGAKRAWAVWLLAGASCAAEPLPGVVADDPAGRAEADGSGLRSALQSKLQLVKLQLTRSPAVQRVQQSDHALAKQKLADARVAYDQAEVQAVEGRQDAAIKLLDHALREIVAASNLVPDPAQEAVRVRGQNQALREAIRMFHGLHKGLSSRMASIKLHAPSVGADIDKIDGMVERADALLANGQQSQANVLLSDAHRIVVSALNRMLSAETIIYELKFDSPAEEFRHELARNRSLEELVPIALTRLNVASEAAALAERYMRLSRGLSDAAQKQAGDGNYPAALKSLQDATNHLERALRIAGLVVPQSPEIKP
jgi:hypothetical protein